VTDQAVDVAHVVEIKALILPAVADMAACAAGPVAVEVDAKIVDGVGFFTEIDPFFVPDGIGRRAMPVPVSGFQDRFTLLLVAAQAVLGNCSGIHVAGELDQLVVVGHLFGMAGQAVGGCPGVQSPGNGAPYHGAVDDWPPDMGHLFGFLVAVHTELMISPLEARGVQVARLKGFGMAY